MATYPAYYITNDQSGQRENLGKGLPVISEGLDSVRTYQFEMHFELPPDVLDTGSDKFTLACKQVSQVGFATEPLEVHRVNDKVFYPGKASPDELTCTFDNLYDPQIANQLWRWFSSIYNPVTGKFNENGGPFKANKAIITQLDAQGQPLMETRLFGVFPTSWKTAEFNYGTNEFHTIEMAFRYDFMEQDSADKGPIPSTARAL
jgi:hypothetical protein|tara:strand:- start:84 stop:695 length:612 start_codon:yes stop_codon:yes gene_type:complete